MKRILALLLLVVLANTAPQEEFVPYLPGMDNFAYKMYSGYLPINNTGKALHYIFVESQKDPANDPVLVWFNGGPGCSSMLGFMQEHGPYVMDDETEFFHYNNYSWNQEANVIYIESPAGVGYSVCNDTSECDFDDTSSSEDNIVALRNFFIKFPEYGNHDLYLSGESYAGVYAPYLSWQIYNWNLDSNKDFKFNLKGFLIGNPVTNWEWDGDASYIKMAYYFNFYNKDYKNKLDENNCNYLYMDVGIEPTQQCKDLWDIFEQNYTSDILIYDIMRRCLDPGPFKKRMLQSPVGEVQIGDELKQYKRVRSSNYYTPWRKASKINKQGVLRAPPIPPIPVVDHCEFGIPYIEWINNATIRQLLHIPDYVQSWNECIDPNYTMGQPASQWIYDILRKKYRMLIYSGDTDGAVPTHGTMYWINQLNWEIKEKYRPYYVDQNANPSNIAGYVQERDGLTFATIRDCGHMAPQWKRKEAYHLVFNWMFNRTI